MSEYQVSKPKRSHSALLKIALIMIIVLFAVAIAFNFIKNKKIGEYLSNLPETANPVTAITVQSSEWTPVIETTGLVRPNQGAMLSSQAAGTVKSINVTSGQQVKKGDLLVALDDDVEVANLRATEAQLPAARLTYQRYSNLFASRSVSQQELDNAKAIYEQLVANVNSLKAAVERRKIFAPFDGVTGIVQVNVGQYINVGTPIVRVEDTSVMKVDFSISQNLLDKVAVGQKVTATSDARAGETFAARISAIEPAVSSSTGLVDLQATFETEDGKKLLSGMFTRLRVALPTERQQIVVPQVAITYNMYGESTYLLMPLSEEDKAKLSAHPAFAHKDNMDKLYRAKQITVFTKDRQGIYAQLKGDEVKIGNMLVTGGQQRLSNGSLVLVTDKQGVGTVQPAKKTNL